MTPDRRTRRTKAKQARDILQALLKDQEAEAAKHKAAYEAANLRATSTRRAIELLDQPMLPEFNIPQPPRRIENGDDPSMPNQDFVMTEAEVEVARLMAEAEAREAPPSVLTNSAPRQYRQRIGEKAEDSLTCPECKHELPWHIEGCTVLAARLKEGL